MPTVTESSRKKSARLNSMQPKQTPATAKLAYVYNPRMNSHLSTAGQRLHDIMPAMVEQFMKDWKYAVAARNSEFPAVMTMKDWVQAFGKYVQEFEVELDR